MNIPIIDLHSHSNISDGLLTPADLMLHAAENNVQAPTTQARLGIQVRQQVLAANK